MLGSFDGENWLWAWGNPFLKIPEDKTTLSRGARESIGAVGERPFVDLEGRGPHEIAMQVMAAGFGDAYYVCEFPGSQIPYALLPGQLAPKWPKLYELQRALTDALETGLPHAAESLANAAKRMGLAVDRTAARLLIVDGTNTMTANLDGDHITGVTTNTTL
jgi:hypothetical protein